MFASLFQSKKRRPSETTPLLAALNRYRSHHHGADQPDGDDAPGVAHDDGDEEDEDEDRPRDGSLLPVFSSTFLGKRQQLRGV
jgi:hypothetical protein